MMVAASIEPSDGAESRQRHAELRIHSRDLLIAVVLLRWVLAVYEEHFGPITLEVRIGLAWRIVGIGIAWLLIGLVLLYLIGRSSPSRRRHGMYVVAWMVAGWFIAGLAAVPYIDGVRYWPGEADLGAAGFGMLAGWVVGMIHGALALWLWPPKKAEPRDAIDSR